MRKLSISVLQEELGQGAGYCRREGLGIEITTFAFPEKLDGDVDSLLRQHRRELAGIAPMSFHGPFFDLVATSMDPRIVEVARSRHISALRAAASLGADIYVTHTNYTPVIRNPKHRENWTVRMLDFWLPLADMARESGITICLENLWEPTPDIQLEFLEQASHLNLRATLDNGHVLVFSKISTVQWVEALAPYLVHCHLHDNMGETDQHLPVGRGLEDWPALLNSLERCAPDAVLVAESDSLEHNMRSVELLREWMNASTC